jgi:surfactin synthase thioesterase subunit
MKAAKTRWIAYRQVKPHARLRLFCFPYAGGGASIFRSWGSYLPDAVELCPVQLPGRETRIAESPYCDIEPLVDALCENLGPFLDLPYALFGYSMGALIAFELARTLSARLFRGPCHVFVGARSGPQLADPDPPTSGLSDDEFMREVAAMGGMPPVLLENREWLEFVLPTLRTDFALCENYKYSHKEALRCPLTVYGGIEDAKTRYEGLQLWKRETSAECVVRQFQGGHFFINSCQDPLLRAISEALSRYMLLPIRSGVAQSIS